MKKLIVLAMILSFSTMLMAQIDVSPAKTMSPKKIPFTPELLSKLKASKTFIVVRDSEEEKIPDIEATIKEVWTVTQFEVVTYREFIEEKLYEDKSCSFLTLSGSVIVTYSKNGTSYKTYVYMSLWMTTFNSKGKATEQNYARIELFPTYPTIAYSMFGSDGRKESNNPFSKNTDYSGLSFLDYLYKESVIYNYNWIFFKNYLRIVNDNLVAATNRWMFQNQTEISEITALKRATLYVPDYCLVRFNPFTGDESQKMKEADFIGKYPYPIKIVSMDELASIIAESQDPIYYLVYVKSCTDKFLSIYNSQTGKIIYNRYKAASYNIKNSDLMELSKIITKPPVK